MENKFVIILKDGAKHFEEVKELCKNKPFIEYSDKGWFAIVGNFNEEEIKKYEYYPLRKDGKMFDWQTESGFQDRVL